MPPMQEQGMHREDKDSKGNARRNREMSDGTMFFGSDEEYADEMERRRDEGKE